MLFLQFVSVQMYRCKFSILNFFLTNFMRMQVLEESWWCYLPLNIKLMGWFQKKLDKQWSRNPQRVCLCYFFFRILIAKCTGGCYAVCEFGSIRRAVGLRGSDYFRGEMKWKLRSHDYLGQSISLITLSAKANLVQGFPYTVVLDNVYKSYKSQFLFSRSWFFEENTVKFTCNELYFIYQLTSGLFSDNIKAQWASSPAWKPPGGDRRRVTRTPSPFGGAIQRQSRKPKGGPGAGQHGASEARTHWKRWGGSRATAGAGVWAEAGWAGAAFPSGELKIHLGILEPGFLVFGGV